MNLAVGVIILSILMFAVAAFILFLMCKFLMKSLVGSIVFIIIICGTIGLLSVFEVNLIRSFKAEYKTCEVVKTTEIISSNFIGSDSDNNPQIELRYLTNDNKVIYERFNSNLNIYMDVPADQPEYFETLEYGKWCFYWYGYNVHIHKQ